MKTIEVDEELYRYIARHTQNIGESAQDILRRMLKFTAESPVHSAQSRVTVAEAPVAQQRQDWACAIDELLRSDAYTQQKKAVNRFILVLSTLYTLAPQAFSAATESLHGRTRIYFAEDRQTLLQSGTRTKPKPVTKTPYWVITNTNTARKRSMVRHIMRAMSFSEVLTEKVCGTI